MNRLHHIPRSTAIILTAIALLMPAIASAQGAYLQSVECPGWNNPVNFLQYTGQVGSRVSGSPNAVTATTGMSFTSTVLTGNALANETYTGSSVAGNIPEPNKQFRIMQTTDQSTGYAANLDPSTAGHLPFVPTQFNTVGQDINTNITKSIRIGDGNGGTKAVGLYYEITPTSSNALLFVYYSCVVQKPYPNSVHGTQADPSFIIRVMRKNASNQWVQISDTLAYYVTSTPAQGAIPGTTTETGSNYGTVVLESSFDSNGWHQVTSGGNYFFYKDWSKVAINLSSYLYTPLRIEILSSDCAYSAHCAYAYVAGECRPMDLTSSGCPPGMATDVTTITAPPGMLQYEWAASEWGVSASTSDLNPGGPNSYFTFRTLASGTEAQGMNVYHAQANDFKVYYRPNANHTPIPLIDSVGNRQTIRCNMLSAIDPAKPFWSPLYINIQNTKPTMLIDTLSLCDGRIQLTNVSYVPGDPSLVVDSLTTWQCYNSPDGSGPVDTTFTGQMGYYQCNNTDIRTILVRTNTTDPECYSEGIYHVKPLQNPPTGFTISNRVLCDADETRLADTTSDIAWRTWYFRSENDTNGTQLDSITGRNTDQQIINRGFTHAVEPIHLVNYNGLYYVNPLLTTDTIWCHGDAYDTVAVFLHPELEVIGDTIVCQGSLTDATVRAIGVEGCTYEWSRTNGTITGGLPAGDHLAVEPYADTAVYYVKVTSPQGCVAWDSVHAYLVRPHLSINPLDGRICPGDTATLTGLDADHYTWTASPADPTLAGQDSNTIIRVSPEQTTTYTLIGHGSNDCDAAPITQVVTIYPLPIPSVIVDPSIIDSDHPTATLRDNSTYSVNSSWLFNNSERVDGQQVTHTFEEALGSDSVRVLLTSYNALNCPINHMFSIPVVLFTAWFPNIITPNSDDQNSTFRMFSRCEYEYFQILIYNRRGSLVYKSDNPLFEWDGHDMSGRECPQGAYVYVCNYRKPGVHELKKLTGSVTILR